MVVLNNLTVAESTPSGAPDDADHFPALIADETEWRTRPQAPAGGASQKVIATRWRAFGPGICDVRADTPLDHHVVAIVLRHEDVRFAVGGRVIHDGAALPGMFHVAEPNVGARCTFRGGYDVLHLHVPNALIADYAREMVDAGVQPLGSASGLGRDSTVERLGRALLAVEEAVGTLSRLYADCVSTSIVARLLATARRTPVGARGKVAELARWRLKRVMEYVEAGLAEPLSLADLASAAGLTRMHFAAQFRAATGVPPHEYVLRRRIERAQEMLLDRRLTLVEVALSVGFQTQSHFTTVFKRFTGQPPRAWRQAQIAAGGRQAHWLDFDPRGHGRAMRAI